MGHTDVVNVDPKKWTHPPFGATRDGGYVYGRGTVDDKDNVVAALMTMLTLKRLNVPLDRDVIFLAEAGEEGSTRVGIQFMTQQHFPKIEAEYCLAEGGGVDAHRREGQVRVGADAREDPARHRADRARRRRPRLGAAAVEPDRRIWRPRSPASRPGRPPIRLNDTTRAYFKRLADDLDAGGREALSRRHRRRSEARPRLPTSISSSTSRGTPR